MQKLLLVLSIIFIYNYSYSQSHTPGTFNFSLGFDGGAHGVLYNEKFDNGTIILESEQDTSGAVTSMFRFDGHINVLKSLSIGVQYRKGQYIEDPDNTQAAGNKLNVLALSARFYAVNKDNFAMYVGGSFGATSLTMNRQLVFITTIPYVYKFKGSHFGLELGFNWYITNNFGFNLGLGYVGQKYLMKEHTFNGVDQDLSNNENTLVSKGATLNMGLTFKLGGK